MGLSVCYICTFPAQISRHSNILKCFNAETDHAKLIEEIKLRPIIKESPLIQTCNLFHYYSVVVWSPSHVQLFVTPWISARQAFLSFTISQSLLKLMSIESVMPSNYLVLCHPFSCLQSSPASGSFPMSQLFASGGQSTGISASILPMNIQE